ncbi:MAG: lyase family protein [Patescibacteria group bacterium]
MSGSISPLDGRYREEVATLQKYFSEEALNEQRLWVETRHLIALSKIGVVRPLTEEERGQLDEIARPKSWYHPRIKEIEREISHDTKAVEHFLREQFKGTSLEDLIPFLHYCLTATDIDNLAWGMLFQRALFEEVQPNVAALVAFISEAAEEYKDYSMVGRTHGQPALPTTFGRELSVFAEKLSGELGKLKTQRVPGKLTGSVGNFFTHRAVHPEVDWIKFSEDFVRDLGLNPKLVTTQVPPYEDLCEIFDTLRRINLIVIDLDRDIWDYASRGYFRIKQPAGQATSSTMPQKTNPMGFERSEAYLKVANALFEVLSRELPLNRLQRDLTDKYLLRVVGDAVGYSYLSWKATQGGLARLHPDRDALRADLLNHWEVLAEAIHNILRKHGYADAYELVKEHFHGKNLDVRAYQRAIKELNRNISKEAGEEINQLRLLQ